MQKISDKWSDFKDGDEKFFDMNALTGEKIKDRKFIVNDMEGQDEESMETFKSLGLSAIQIDKFYSTFRAIDGDNGGDIDMHEFYVFFDLEESPFVDRTFGLFDRDDSGKIDFEEFVCAVWNFCTTSTEMLIPFAFNLYDLDGSKDLDPEEVDVLVTEILGDQGTNDEEVAQGGGGDLMDGYKVNVDRLMKKLKPSKNGKIDIKAFTKFVQRAPEAMKPAYELQQTLRERVIGEAYWKTAMRKRDKVISEQRSKGDSAIGEGAGGGPGGNMGFILKEVVDGVDKDSVKGRYDELANNEYEAAKFRIEEAAKLRLKIKMQNQLWEAQNEATSGANQDPLDLIAKLDDPSHEGELKDGMMKSIEEEIYLIRHMQGEKTWEPRVERTFGVHVPGGMRRNRLLSSTAPRKGKKKMSALRTRAMRLEEQERLGIKPEGDVKLALTN